MLYFMEDYLLFPFNLELPFLQSKDASYAQVVVPWRYLNVYFLTLHDANWLFVDKHPIWYGQFEQLLSM